MSKKESRKPKRPRLTRLGYFLFGFSVADYLAENATDNGRSQFRAMIEVLLDVANEELTLRHTPEETMAEAESVDPELAVSVGPRLRDVLRRGRSEDRRYAEKVLEFIRKE